MSERQAKKLRKAQTTEVVNNMYNISTILPVCLYVVVILALTFVYTLNKKKVEETHKNLVEWKKGT